MKNVWRVLPYFFAVAGFLATVMLHPAELGNDAFTQCVQAKTGFIADWHPPVMAATWQILQHIFGGFAVNAMYLFYSGLVWFGYFLVIRSAKYFWTTPKPFWSIAAVVFLFLWLCFDLQSIASHVTKDTGMLGAYLVAAGLLLSFPKQMAYKVFFAVLAFIFIAYGTALRHNAVFAALPLIVWLVQKAECFSFPFAGRKGISVSIAAVVLWLAMLAGIHYVNYGVIKAVRLYPQQELMYLDTLHLNAITKNYIPPPDTFGNDFSILNKESFLQDFNSDQLGLRSALKKLNDGKPAAEYLRLDRSLSVPYPDSQKEQAEYIIAQLQTLTGDDLFALPVSAAFVQEQYPKDYLVLKDAWIKRIKIDFPAYIKFKSRYFLRLCRDNYIWFLRLNALQVLPFITLIAVGLLFSKQLFSVEKFPAFCLAWSALLYILPYYFIQAATEGRYLIWFFAASLISIGYVLGNSELTLKLINTIHEHFCRSRH